MAKKKGTTIPGDSALFLTDDVRSYCARTWGLYSLPDAFLTDFIECYTQNQTPHISWEMTFKVFIRRSSPSGGRFYHARTWDERCTAAKKHPAPLGPLFDKPKAPAPVHRPTTWRPTEHGREQLQKLRLQLAEGRGQ